MAYELKAKSVEVNPSAARLRELTERMPNATVTEFGNVDVKTEVLARSTASTYIVTDDPSSVTDQTVSREEYARLARRQDDYIAEQDMVVVDGYIGSDPAFRTRARLIIESANANIAGMQQQLYYPLEPGDDSDPVTTVVYTPNLTAPGYPNDRAILVDVDANITRS